MIPTQTFENFPEFANAGTKTKPNDAKYAQGFLPSDVLPAEWLNYFLAGATKGVTALNTGAANIEAEINTVLSAKSITPDATLTNQLLSALNQFKAEAILAAHPVGSLYWTSSIENPAITFGGGTWTQIKDKFVWAKGDSDTVNATGGAKTVTLEVANLPSHNHTFTGSSHSHSFTPSGTISVKTNPTFTGNEVSTGNSGDHSHSTVSQSALSTDANNRGHTHTLNSGNTSSAGTTTTAGFRFASGSTATDGSHHHNFRAADVGGGITNGYSINASNGCLTGNRAWSSSAFYEYGGGSSSYQLISNTTHSHSLSSVTGYLYGKTDDENQTHTHTFAHTHATNTRGAHTHTVTAEGTISGGAYTFSGTAGTTGNATQGGTIGNTGSGTAVNKMPPYIIKYCWERTA